MRIRHAPALFALAAVLLLAGPSSAAMQDVHVTLSDSLSATTIAPGGSFTVTFSATNSGTDAQTPFSLVLNLGSGYWTVGGANDGCSRPNDFDIDCERASLAPGETFKTSVVVTLGANAAPGSIYNVRIGAYPGTDHSSPLPGAWDTPGIQVGAAPPPPPPPPGPSTLSVALRGSGSGSVMSSPAGISCGGACAVQFAHGTAVTLTATPSAGSVFTGWGDGCAAAAQNAQCTVTMNADTAVSATFDPAPVTTPTPPAPPLPAPEVCVVPRVVGMTLTAAKLRLTHALCTAGTISRRNAKRTQVGHVVAQHPAAGEYLAAHGKVALVIGKQP
jgi:List-Bact-rpt repeat protein/PASTA domain-containing protein